MPSPHSRRGLALGLCAAALGAAALPSVASAAAPAKWQIFFTHDVPATPTNVNPDDVYVRGESGNLPAGSSAVLTITRAGSVIARSYPSRYSGDVQVPGLNPGDVASFTNVTTGAVYATATYDGRPSFDANTCDGSAALSGLRTGNALITNLYAYHYAPATSIYGGSSQRLIPTDINNGTLASLSGETFTGAFERPLPAGSIVSASSTLLASPTLTVYSTIERTTTACPPPPVVVPPAAAPAPATPAPAAPKDTTAPKVLFSSATAKPNKITLKKLTSPGLSFVLTSDEKATVNATLLLTPPAKKASSKKKPAAPITLTTVTVPASPGTPVTVILAITKKQKKAIEHAKKGSSLVAHVTVTDAAGNVTTPGDVTFKAPTK